MPSWKSIFFALSASESWPGSYIMNLEELSAPSWGFHRMFDGPFKCSERPVVGQSGCRRVTTQLYETMKPRSGVTSLRMDNTISSKMQKIKGKM